MVVNHSKKIKVGLLQIGNGFSNQYFLPYSIGLLQAYAQQYLKNPDKFEFMLPIYRRMKIYEAVSYLIEADIIYFSVYLWNYRISSEIARRIKEVNRGIVIVFGGRQIPVKHESLELFLRNNIFVDLACYGEGEIPFLKILENFEGRLWDLVPTVGYIDSQNKFIQNQPVERISDLNTIPSPYLEGIFDPLMETCSQVEWSVLFETNRGCPFSCAFCAWGTNETKKIFSYNLHRIFEEIDWICRKKIKFVFCCDANFGILKRDMDIVARVAENKRLYGYPEAFSVQNTKNSTRRVYDLQKMLNDAKLQRGVNLALQSMNKKTLKSIKRSNITTETFQELQKMFLADSIPTFSDIILGLPDESYDSFTNGISNIIENGQHNNIQFISLTILENTAMSEPEYQKRHGLLIQDVKSIYRHGSLDDNEEVHEIQKIVVGSNTMPKEDWIRARVFCWLTTFLHFNKLLQIPIILLSKISLISYKEIIEIFLNINKEFPLISEIVEIFEIKAFEIQSGNPEYTSSKKWLNIWWPADEYIFIKLNMENKLNEFYNEAEMVFTKYLEKNDIKFPGTLLHEAVYLNQAFIKKPFVEDNLEIELSYNIPEFYQKVLLENKGSILEEKRSYIIQRRDQTWTTWDEWLKEVVWYGSKKKAYLYPYTLAPSRQNRNNLAVKT